MTDRPGPARNTTPASAGISRTRALLVTLIEDPETCAEDRLPAVEAYNELDQAHPPYPPAKTLTQTITTAQVLAALEQAADQASTTCELAHISAAARALHTPLIPTYEDEHL